ncbi:hypothetical protein J6590_005257 [Homalodisca vitripennis]|nr:hypothetical protein J6590_005257 [Homalodisca vitripennis]
MMERSGIESGTRRQPSGTGNQKWYASGYHKSHEYAPSPDAVCADSMCPVDAGKDRNPEISISKITDCPKPLYEREDRQTCMGCIRRRIPPVRVVL